MKPIKFARQVLRIVKKDFPHLYEEKIEGRLDQFIGDHAQSSEGKTGQKIGQASTSLRLIWSVHKLLKEEGLVLMDCAEDEVGSQRGPRTARAIAHCVMAELCFVAFWKFVLAELNSKNELKGCLALMPDWSIIIFDAETTGGKGEKIDDELDVLLHGIKGVAIIASLCEPQGWRALSSTA